MLRGSVVQRRRYGDGGVSEAQAVLVLLFIVLVLGIVVKVTFGDGIVAVSERIMMFRVWGGENNVSEPVGERSFVTISSPRDGGTWYIDECFPVDGRVVPGQGRKVVLVFYRFDGGEWVKAQLSGDRWAGRTERYAEGDYVVEAVAYDDLGNESEHAFSCFTVLFRYFNNARHVSDDIPPRMVAGDRYPCQITYENTGNIVWTKADGYSLASYGGGFGPDSIQVPAGGGVVPSHSNTFCTVLTAPEAPGSYPVAYRMQGGGYGWFGEETSRCVRVDPVVRDAKVVSIDMPAEMTEGDTYQARITMRNTGTGTWYSDGNMHAALGAVNGDTGDTYKFTGWNTKTMNPGSTVKPGEEYTFQFQIKAPGTGEYELKSRMIAGNKEWYGEQANKKIKMNPKTNNGGQENNEDDDEPYQAYLAYGNFWIWGKDGDVITNYMCEWCYDGPLVRHNSRSSYVKQDGYSDWDIGGPNGKYHVYSDNYYDETSFNMDNGGYKGTITFYEK